MGCAKMANGLYTNSELVDTIIVDLNKLIAEVVNGQFIQACGIVTQISQRLLNLRTNIDADLKSKDEVIEDLKAAIRSYDHEKIGLNPEPPVAKSNEKEGANNGCD